MLLRIDNLHLRFDTRAGPVPAVTGLALHVDRGETVALVGESGCGKSVTALAILRLLPGNAQITGGRILFDGQDVLTLSRPALRTIRGRRIALIFQEPGASLNPVLTIGEQIAEVLRLHRGLRGRAVRERVVDLLRLVRLPDPERRRRQYAHELSGGMQQRVMIALALAGEPELLIADEPTTALDVTVQAQIIDLLKDVQARTQLAILFITHDLAVVAGLARSVYVMYAGRIVEHAPTRQLFSDPQHPYTQGLLRCSPRIRTAVEIQSPRRLPVIPGEVPHPARRPRGCPFHPRCEVGHTDAQCRQHDPPLEGSGADRRCACWHVGTPGRGDVRATSPRELRPGGSSDLGHG